ncbi:GTPase [Longimycelium tulufanense]|uniref:GTPase n=1 Tax=Longimycelium tulufanense TaxID=907463 RepID=A0A8J3C8K4_9PSEU|nr:dynamin family protein [Longimycelium tulufanense]GGM33938.1 GTPase [Longimycelium tulufanense]
MNGTPSLGVSVRGLLRNAIEVYRDTPDVATTLRRHLDRMDEPLRVAIAGKVKSGKSTLLNALVGEEVAATDAAECTRVLTWYRDAMSPRVALHPVDGVPRQVPIHRRNGALHIDLQGASPEQLDRIVVDWPSQHLRALTLIDTPGIASLSTEVSARTTAFLTPEDEAATADAVVYLMRHLHGSDIGFLESFHDRGVAKANPVNAIAVLCRVDEVGGGRVDALLSARKIAQRYRTDPKLRGLCQTVVPVAGLLACTGRTLRQAEFIAIGQLATAPRADVERILLSVDRFVCSTEDLPASLTDLTVSPVDVRVGLLARLGLFGVRLAVTLVRQGHHQPARLAAELVRRSGLDDLRQVLSAQFTERADLLKARSALLALDVVLQRDPRPRTGPLAAEVERILAGAHEFAELRLLSSLRSGVLPLPPEAAAEAERLLGGSGRAPTARLGLERHDPDEIRRAGLDALGRWRRRAENPLSSRAVTDAARIVVRSCEGLLAETTAQS